MPQAATNLTAEVVEASASRDTGATRVKVLISGSFMQGGQIVTIDPETVVISAVGTFGPAPSTPRDVTSDPRVARPQ